MAKNTRSPDPDSTYDQSQVYDDAADPLAPMTEAEQINADDDQSVRAMTPEEMAARDGEASAERAAAPEPGFGDEDQGDDVEGDGQPTEPAVDYALIRAQLAAQFRTKSAALYQDAVNFHLQVEQAIQAFEPEELALFAEVTKSLKDASEGMDAAAEAIGVI